MIKGRADITFYFDSKDEAEIVYNSVNPETSFFLSGRTDVKFGKKGTKICLDVKAEDPASFRAALGTYLKWIKVSIITLGGYK